MSRIRATYAIGALLPGLPVFSAGRTYAAWPVWSNSSTCEARFAPLPKKQAAQIWHKARRFDRQTRQPGKHGGAVGRTALNVLYALLFEFLDYRTGRLDPSYDGLAYRAGVCRRAVASALQRLRALGILNWLRRCRADRDAAGRLKLIQETNAYAVLPPSQWRGYTEPPEPCLSEWGATPPLACLVEQAAVLHRDGCGSRTLAARLDADPSDRLAAALASFGRALFAAQTS